MHLLPWFQPQGRGKCMREPYAQLYIHIVWATWDRLPLLSGQREAVVYACIQAECEKVGAELIAIGGTEDHIHVVTRIPATLAVATLVKQIKGSSSNLVNHAGVSSDAFKWQGAYGAFSVSKAAVSKVVEYVVRQKEHHREGSLHKSFEACGTECSQSP